jgi:peroxiredoxin
MASFDKDRVIALLLDEIDRLKDPSAAFKNVVPAIGSQFPDVTLDDFWVEGTPTVVNMRERLTGKTTIILGLPGAFTPC